jgi:CDGSH-type Zn-finger protein/uncharacterized Fe-S cluster protein YjdI
MAKISSYDAEGIRVTYDAARCIHVAECVHGLPDVFDPESRPWIDAGAASPDELAAVVRRCPTGALAYERLDGGSQEKPAPGNELRMVPNGPIYASGDLVLLDADRRELSREIRAAFCRCGDSRNMPFCDGGHVEAGFEDSGDLGVPMVRETGNADQPELTVRLRADGPLVLEGRFRIEGADGGDAEGSTGALCRCGASKNKPFCDGTHREVGFAPEDPTAG